MRLQRYRNRHGEDQFLLLRYMYEERREHHLYILHFHHKFLSNLHLLHKQSIEDSQHKEYYNHRALQYSKHLSWYNSYWNYLNFLLHRQLKMVNINVPLPNHKLDHSRHTNSLHHFYKGSSLKYHSMKLNRLFLDLQSLFHISLDFSNSFQQVYIHRYLYPITAYLRIVRCFQHRTYHHNHMILEW